MKNLFFLIFAHLFLFTCIEKIIAVNAVLESITTQYPMIVQTTSQIKANKSIPQKFRGDWFSKTTGEWEISFQDSLAIYKKQIWSYADINFKSVNGFILLKNNVSEIKLFVKYKNSDFCLIGEEPESMITCCKEKLRLKNHQDSIPFESPIFKTEDSVVLSGYLKGYNPKSKIKTGLLVNENIIKGERNVSLFKISENGSFSIKLPIYYPHEVRMMIDTLSSNVFLEPGKNLFVMIDLQNGEKLFMGESAGLNIDLISLRQINTLEELKMDPPLNMKAYQIKEIDIKYKTAIRFIATIGSYGRLKDPYHEKLDAEMFEFYNSGLLNNPLSIISKEYFIFVYLFKGTGLNGPYTIIEIAKELENSGYHFTDEELQLIDAAKKIELLQNELRALNKKYGEQFGEISMKYAGKLPNFIEEFKLSNGETITKINYDSILFCKNITLTEEEKVVLNALKTFDETELYKECIKFEERYSIKSQVFMHKHLSFINNIYRKKVKESRKDILKKITELEKVQFILDILTAQEFDRTIWENDSLIESPGIKDKISTPLIMDYLSNCCKKNDKGIQSINDIQKKEANLVFDSLTNKYRGKVMYITFWEGKNSIINKYEQSNYKAILYKTEQLKKELDQKDIVFMYIASPRTSKDTLTKIVSEFKGEHYQLSKDEWNYLKVKFQLIGDQNNVLINKKGAIVYFNLMYWKELLKYELLKHINEEE